MPLAIHKGSRLAASPPGSRKRAAPTGEKQPVPPWLLVVAGLVLVVFIAFMFHRYVRPLPGLGPRYTVTTTQPLPGMPDAYPYNTKEWQELYTKGWVVGPDNKTIKQKELEMKAGGPTGPAPGGLVSPAPGMPPVPPSSAAPSRTGP
jgi:hypothetical protein